MKKLLLLLLGLLSFGMQAQNVTFADANFKKSLLGSFTTNEIFRNAIVKNLSGNIIKLDANNDGEIQIAEAEIVSEISISVTFFHDITGIKSFTNLKKLTLSDYLGNDNEDFTIDVQGLSNLKELNLIAINNIASPGHLSTNFQGTGLEILRCIGNHTIHLNLEDSPSLKTLDISGNPGIDVDFSKVPELIDLTCMNDDFTSLILQDVAHLQSLNCSYNNISELDLSQNSKLTYLDCSVNQIKNIPLPGLSDITTFLAGGNLLENAGLDFAKLFAVNNLDRVIDLSFNNFSQNINLSFPVSFSKLNLSNNKISDFKISGTFSSWYGQANLLLNDNLLEHINLGNINSLNNLYVFNNPLAEIDTPNLETGFLDFSNTNVSYIKLNSESRVAMNLFATQLGSTTLKLICQSGSITLNGGQSLETIDLSDSKMGIEQIQNMPMLKSIFMKNGVTDQIYSPIFNTPNLKFICADEIEIGNIKDQLSQSGSTDVNINTYCSFTPAGNYNTISGTAKFDANNNGCDATDNAFEFLKLKINDGTTTGETFVQKDGKYEFYTQEGNFTVTQQAENPTLFNVSPSSFSASFADANNNSFVQDICVTANGNKNDAEVVIAPLTGARPGFDATYKLVWRNKGNTTLSGKVIFNFDSNKMTFKESSLPYSALSNGSIEFNYANLKPYANDGAEITFTVNTPTNPTNPVNSGDILAFNTQITPSIGDLTPEDNNFGFNHTVVNSFDPNDIVCMEGETIPSVAVGKYMHYVVNFENIGTAEAENIVVKMDIDPAEFDINTLQLQNASGTVTTVITGNQAEFIFKKIKLKGGGKGNVLLKIKSNTALQEGDVVNNKANIFFDYNFPVETNDYETTIQNQNSVLAAKINYAAANFTSGNYAINFDGNLSTGGVVNYIWEFSGNPAVSSNTVANPVVTYATMGDYTAKLTVYDINNNSHSQSISFRVGDITANLSTGKDSVGNFMTIDTDDDDWKGYDINGTEITPKVRHTFTGWSNADIGNGVNSQWITLNNTEGYYNYKSREFVIPANATDAKLNLRSLSFVRNWTYLVKVNADGSEEETEITKTQWMSDGFKGWLNSRSPRVTDYALLPGRYYIKVLVYSNNNLVRESLDVNAVVSCTAGLINGNKKAPTSPTLGTESIKMKDIVIYPIPTKGDITILANDIIKAVEVYDTAGRITQKNRFDSTSKKEKISITGTKGVYYLKVKTAKEEITQKIIKE